MRLGKVAAVSAGLIGVMFVTMLAGGLAGAWFASRGLTSADAVVTWVMGAVAIVLMIGAIWVGALWMRSIDEAAREAHKAAWYWGGTGGMAVGGVFVILALLPAAEAWPIAAIQSRTDPAVFMAAGALGMLFLMLAGYGLVWCWWWLSRSRG